MGDRAVIQIKDRNGDSGGTELYLHWNGSADYVEGFLAYMDLMGARCEDAPGYGIARLAQVTGNWLGDTLSVGVYPLDGGYSDNWDNGTYLVKGWRIVGRLYMLGADQYDGEAELEAFIRDIDACMPERCRLTEKQWSRLPEVVASTVAARETCSREYREGYGPAGMIEEEETSEA